MKKMIVKNQNLFIFLCSILFITIFHIFSYDRFGYYVDEIGSMYDAYCISNFGVDRWLHSYPIHFLNYGDGQCSIFVYLLAIAFKLFGYSKIVIRSIPWFFHILTIFFISKTMGLYKKEYEIYGYILTTILPIFYLLFQFGLESHFMISLSAGFLYYFLKGIKKKKNIDFIISGIFIGLTFHTYVLSYLLLPIFILFYIGYCVIRKKITGKQIFGFMIPVLFFGIPLLFVQLINIFDLEQITILGITFPKFLVYRTNELGFSRFFQNLYETFINTNFYEGTIHLCIPKFGNIYYISIPFLIIGFIKHCRQFKENHISAAFILWTISNYFLAGILEEDGLLNNTRLNALYLAKFFYIIEGLIVCIDILKKGKKWLKIGIITIYSISFIWFMSFYFTEYDLNIQSNLFSETYEDLPEITDKIVYVPDNYVFFLWSKKINPYDFDIMKNGYLSYQNYRMGYQNLDTESYYLISKKDYVSQDTFYRLGFHKSELKHFYLYSFQ